MTTLQLEECPKAQCVKVLSALVESITASLGDRPKPKEVAQSVAILSRQLEALIGIDPWYEDAFREVLLLRILPFVPGDKGIERVFSELGDPNHACWAAIAPRHLLRRFCVQLFTPPTPAEEMLEKLQTASWATGGTDSDD